MSCIKVSKTQLVLRNNDFDLYLTKEGNTYCFRMFQVGDDENLIYSINDDLEVYNVFKDLLSLNKNSLSLNSIEKDYKDYIKKRYINFIVSTDKINIISKYDIKWKITQEEGFVPPLLDETNRDTITLRELYKIYKSYNPNIETYNYMPVITIDEANDNYLIVDQLFNNLSLISKDIREDEDTILNFDQIEKSNSTKSK